MRPAITVDSVSKQYLIGRARYSSLRDVIANGWNRIRGKSAQSETARTRRFDALKDINFEVEQGTTLGIIGPNGAGKSTLLKLISRVTKPTSGSIHTHGRVSALIEVGAGFHPELTGRENLYLNGSILGMTRREINGKLGAIVDFSGLEEFIDTPVKHYSSGMLVRLGFSVAVHVEPEVLLIDEVLAVGDFRFRRQCTEKMSELLDRGITLVFVSHNLNLVAETCERALYLTSGQVQCLGETEDVISTYLNDGADANHMGVEATEQIVKGACIIDRDGKAVKNFTAGEMVTVRVNLDLSQVPKEPVVGLRIYDSSHGLAAGTNTFLHGFRIVNTQSEIALDFVMERTWFKPGSYCMAVDVAAADAVEKYERRENVLHFQVRAGSWAPGTGYLEPIGFFAVADAGTA
jgi:homopolymeric O-antigen transport system ATP-binding protein